MKRFVFLLMSVMVLTFTLTAWSSSFAATQKHVFKIAHTIFPAPSDTNSSLQEFTKRVTEATDGRITFKIYGAELGDFVQINEMLLRGDLDMFLDPVATNFDPRWAALMFPYIATDYKDVANVFGADGFMNELFKKWAAEKGMYWLGAWVQGFTGVSTNSSALTPAEAKNIKVRIGPIGLVQDVYRKLGFEVVTLPYNETPTAISTGIVDGQAGGGPAQTWNLARDLNKFYLHYRDNLEVWALVANADSWKKLEADDQKIIQEIADDILGQRVSRAEAEEQEYMDKLTKHGFTVIDLIDHPENLARSVELGRQTWPQMEEIIGKEAMDYVRSHVK